MVLQLGADGRVVDGPVPTGAVVKTLAIHDGRLKEILVQVADPGAGGPAFADSVAFALDVPLADTNPAPADAYAASLDATYAETQAAPGEQLLAEVSGPQFAEAAATPTEARDSLIRRWATTNTTAGTAPTNPTNAHGENDGTLATCKAGGLANGTSTLTLTIAAPFTEVPAGATRTLRAYYAFTAGTADACAASVSYRQVGQGANTTVGLPSTGNFLTTGTAVSLTNIDRTVPITVTFTHTATTPATGGSVTVDAVGIETTGAL